MSQSRWASIRLHKARADANKNALYTQLSRAIIVAARQGVPDPEANFALRAAVQKARAAGLPGDNIERAIARGSGLDKTDALEAFRYEGYGPAGVAVIMEILTDNRNRTAADVRAVFNKVGGNLGETGCVGWMFQQKGIVQLEATELSDDLILAIANAGGDDYASTEDGIAVLCDDYSQLEAVSLALSAAGQSIADSQLGWFPDNWVEIDDPATAQQVKRLVDKLSDLDDVQQVFHNAQMGEAALAELGAAN